MRRKRLLHPNMPTEVAASPGTQPVDVMILLSDGNPNASTRYGVSNQFFVSNNPSASGIYPSDVGDCGQAVVAASAAKSAGTQVFAVAYGSSATGSFSWNQNDPSDSINNAGCVPPTSNSFFSGISSRIQCQCLSQYQSLPDYDGYRVDAYFRVFLFRLQSVRIQ